MSAWQHRDDLLEVDAARHPTRDELEAIRLGVREAVVRQAGRRPSRLPLVAGAGALAAAAALVAVLAGPRPLDRELASEVTAQERLGRSVEVVYLGQGLATGSVEDVDIRWEEGTLHTRVAPDRGVRLVVRTPEATVRVVGTVFDVSRDGLGTVVSVSRGGVEVRCAGEAPERLGADEEQRCYRGAEAALHHAREAPDPQAALGIIDRGLTLPGEPTAHRELEVWRLEALWALERDVEALESAWTYLRAGHAHRRLDVLRLASEAAYLAGGCEAALPALEELAGRADAPDAAVDQFRACQGE